MANSISVGELTEAMQKEIMQFATEVGHIVESATMQAAKDGVAELRSMSPNLTGSYAKSWAQKKGTSDRLFKISRVIYSRPPEYRLTHLLENGHAKVLWGNRTGGRVDAIPHIATAEETATSNFVRYVKEGIENI